MIYVLEAVGSSQNPLTIDERPAAQVFEFRSILGQLHRHEPWPLPRLRRLATHYALGHLDVAVDVSVAGMVATSAAVGWNGSFGVGPWKRVYGDR